MELSRYVVLNPVRAGMVKDPGEWEWSSYRATAGLIEVPEFLATEWLLSQFEPRAEAARMRYRSFVMDGVKNGGIRMEAPQGSIYNGRRQVYRTYTRHD